MISLYIHIPFCSQKCKYCSFQVIPLDKISFEDGQNLLNKYVDKLCEEINFWSDNFFKKFGKKLGVRTLYFGGGTPNIIGFGALTKIIDLIFDKFDLEFLEELSFEFNPYPSEEILALVKNLNKKYKKLFRLRYSFGLQTLDTALLQEVGRPSSYFGITDFLRNLQKLKQDNNVFNGDFIAFGLFKKDKKGNEFLWKDNVFEFFYNFVNSLFFDSFSIYTLELQNGNEWSLPLNHEKISEEFHILSDVVLNAGYHRYELSNFALQSKRSLHNMVYWQLNNWLGFGTSATSCLDGKYIFDFMKFENGFKKYRWTNTYNIFEYLNLDFNKKELLKTYYSKLEKEFLDQFNVDIEKAFLILRTDLGLELNENIINKIFVSNWEKKIEEYRKLSLVEIKNNKLYLTGDGMNVYNTIISELFRKL